ncbi:MAG: hypothetical protein JOY58_01280 [Solirubrobacterales bacterium]|nr:hypothetical protein [Solirubrobacterales bacterium]
MVIFDAVVVNAALPSIRRDLAVAVFGALLAHRTTFVDGAHISLLLATAVVLTAAAVSQLLRPVRGRAQAKADLPTEDAPGQRPSNGANAVTTVCATG